MIFKELSLNNFFFNHWQLFIYILLETLVICTLSHEECYRLNKCTLNIYFYFSCFYNIDTVIDAKFKLR